MSALRVHYVREADRPPYESAGFRTACGKEGQFCRGWYPMPGHPGEADDTVCNRFEATFDPDEVTCARCKPAAVSEKGRG